MQMIEIVPFSLSNCDLLVDLVSGCSQTVDIYLRMSLSHTHTLSLTLTHTRTDKCSSHVIFVLQTTPHGIILKWSLKIFSSMKWYQMTMAIIYAMKLKDANIESCTVVVGAFGHNHLDAFKKIFENRRFAAAHRHPRNSQKVLEYSVF